MRTAYHRLCEAGIKGGNSEPDWELRRTELDMDRNTNSRLNRRHLLQAYTGYQACPKWERTESRIGYRTYPKYPRKVPADSEVLNPVSNGNQERDNPFKALKFILSRWLVVSLVVGRIASEANAFGKAKGYADGGTVKWMIEV